MTRASDTARILSGGAVINEDSNDVDFRVESNGNENMLVVDGGNDNVGIGGTGNPTLYVVNNNAGPGLTAANATAVLHGSSDTGKGGCIGFDFGASHTNYPVGIGYVITSQTGSTKGDLAFFARSSTGDDAATERFRIKEDGRLCQGTTSAISGGHFNSLYNSVNGAGAIYSSTDSSGNTHNQIIFFRNSSNVGSIQTTGSSTVYVTTSDYRLKENVTYDFDATSKLKQLKPARFNFKIDANKTVDGFLAHEVSNIVPEAVTGEKDATQDIGTVKDKLGAVLKENVPESDKQDDETWTKTGTEDIYQGIDQSKLVPLLVKTLQEALTRIDTLEPEVKA